MAIFPKIQSPCPYKNDLAAIMDGDMCRMCKRQVVDLTAMSDEGRVAFLSACKEEVCVSYRLPLRAASAAAALAVAGMPMAAAAADAPPPPCNPSMEVVEYVVVGGIKDPAHLSYVKADETGLKPLPVVYEDAGKTPPTVRADGKSTADKPPAKDQAILSRPTGS